MKLLILMLFLHIVDDYYLQGILASLKQKSWWKEHAPDKLYKYDYILALLCHSFSWAFMIMLPIWFNLNFSISPLFIIVFIANICIHAFVDDLKANKKKINLITDQGIHIIQILFTCLIFS